MIGYINDNVEIRNLISSEISKSSRISIATGFFNYKVFELFKQELLSFYDKQGEFRLIIGANTNPQTIEFFQKIQKLSNDDFQKEIVRQIFGDYTDISDEALDVSYKLFSSNAIEIKIGISKSGGLYHPKEYLFKSDKHTTTIIGSFNFTSNAVLNNYESATVIYESNYYDKVYSTFEQLWDDCHVAVNTVDLNKYIAGEIKNEIDKRSTSSSESNINLRDYQKQAIDELIKNDFNGFLEMATGTGKTFTTIFGLKKYLSLSDKTHFTLIVVPYKHLATQWNNELRKVFGPSVKILECHSESNWKSEFKYYISDSCEMNTFSIMVDKTFYSQFDNITKLMAKSNNIFICDEAHNLTLENLERLSAFENVFTSRVGLSATPENYLNEERTNKLFEVFKGAHFKFELAKAIERGYLTKYNYIPCIIDLDSDEEKKYKELVRQINAETNYIVRQSLLDKKSEVLSKAKNKICKLVEIFKTLEDVKYTLVYCSPGSSKTNSDEDKKIIDQVSYDLGSSLDNRIKMRKVVADVSLKERSDIVKALEQEVTDVILAVKCLDEGFDIPAVRQAFILHSTRNPSEFVQRRGRVLRKFKNKDKAFIYDFIVRVDGRVPEEEKKRFIEYWSLSNNSSDYKDFKNLHIGELEDE